MPQVEDYIPYVYKDQDDMARSWDLVIETYKIKLDELKWYKLSIDEQKMKFASFAEIAKNDPERYIKEVALYVESIIHKTVYVIVKKKFHGRSAKEVSNAAMDVINMVALNTRTIAKYNPSFAPSTYMQTYIQSAVTKVLNNNACNSGDERFLKESLKKFHYMHRNMAVAGQFRHLSCTQFLRLRCCQMCRIAKLSRQCV